MADYESLLQKFKSAISKEAPAAESGFNQEAFNVLKANRDKEARLQVNGNDAPLTQNLDLSGVDTSKLPQTNDTGFTLVGSPQDKGFTLGPSSDISRPPVPYVAPQVDNLPSLSGARPDLSGNTI